MRSDATITSIDRLIVFDASALVDAARKVNSTPEQALPRAEEVDVFALSAAIDSEIIEVLSRPKFARRYFV